MIQAFSAVSIVKTDSENEEGLVVSSVRTDQQ